MRVQKERVGFWLCSRASNLFLFLFIIHQRNRRLILLIQMRQIILGILYNHAGQQQYGYGQDASYQAQPAQQNQYGYGQDASYQAQPADYNYQQNSYQQQPQQDAYGYGQPAGYPYAAPIVKKAPGMALAAMILGIVGVVTGFFVFGALLGIAAIILGALSLKKVKEAGAGKGFAITGIVTGAVAVLFSLCMLFVYISVAQTAEKCLEVGTDAGHGNVVCQIGDNPNNRMTVPAHR